MEPGSTPRPLVQKKLGEISVPFDMLLSAVSVLVVAQSSSEIPEGLMNNPVYAGTCYAYLPQIKTDHPVNFFLFISQNIAICLKTFSNHVDSHC